MRTKILALIVTGLMLGVLCSGSAYAAGRSEDGSNSVYVQVRTSQIRAEPKHFARGLRTVKYGEKLTLLSSESIDDESLKGWIEVRLSGGTTGFVHSSAVTPRQVVLEGRSAAPILDSGSTDVVLAGKGFNPEVEREYRSRDASLDYAAVDRMERAAVSTSELQQFATAGKLSLKSAS